MSRKGGGIMIKKLLISISLLLLSVSCFANTYRVSLKGMLIPSPMTANLLRTFKQAGPGDTVYLTIDSPGGRTDIQEAIQRAMSDGERVIAYVPRWAGSAAANLLMYTSERHVAPGARVLFHTGYWENPSNRARVDSKSPEARQLAYESLRNMKPFKRLFTAKEWNQMMYGKDIIIPAYRINRY